MKYDQAYKNVNCTHENYFKKFGNYLLKIRYPARENICIEDNIIWDCGITIFRNRVEYTTASGRIVQRTTCEYNLENISEKLNKVLY
jgi:hypothetical protein